jgi:hypothetical protein
VSKRILVLSDSISALDRLCSSAAWILFRTAVTRLAKWTLVVDGGVRVQRVWGASLCAAEPTKVRTLPLPISALRVAFVALKNPGNIDAAVSLTKEQFR